MARPRLLVVDDEPSTADTIGHYLGADADVVSAPGGDDGIRAAIEAETAGRPFDVVLLDYYMPDTGGVEVLREMNQRGVDARVIIMSGREPGDVAVEAMRLGAFDFISKPLSRAELRLRVERAMRDRRSAAVTDPSKRRPRKSDVIIGGGGWIKGLYERIAMVAPTDVTVAISGESGTGKELVARTVHNLSPRYESPFVVVNCAAIPESLLEDELFGHVKGAFTDATRDREGLFAAADGGTLFLDEIGEMMPALQAKLLRVLQSQEFRRIGDDHDMRVDVRVITATNRDLEKAVAAGTFRQDLYYRINVFPLHLPPLRERREDIALLAHHFLLKHRPKVGKRVEGFTPTALAKLSAYDFPGNVRELENKVHHALVMAQGTQITPEDIAVSGPSTGPGPRIDLARPFRDLKQEMIEGFERDYVEELLRVHHGNLAAAARQAGMDRKNLWAMAKKYGFDLDGFRSPRDNGGEAMAPRPRS
ncbi:MAG TPA: sigma-54 dependent transcriptional regulator [Kofleriaceae bacterium]|nr:sigma-54 dependent transcriptional regulator [Kofleriaceae bacterium]